MAIKNSTYKLDETQFAAALAILEGERKANMPTRWQSISYRIYMIAVYGMLLCWIMSTIAALYDLHPILELVLPIVQLVLLFMIPVLFFMNLRLMIRIWRQNRLVRKLGLSQYVSAPWKAERKRKRFLDIITFIVVCIGVVLVFFGIMWLMGLYETPGETLGRPISIVVGIVLVIMGLSFIFAHDMRKSKERSNVVARLLSSFSQSKKAAEKVESKRVEVPFEYYESVAAIERAQISIDRQKSIAASDKISATTEYIVQMSRSARKILSNLDPSVRTRIEDRIYALVREPQPIGITKERSSDVMHLRVPEAAMDIHYRIDHDDRRIVILNLQLISGKPTLNYSRGGQ